MRIGVARHVEPMPRHLLAVVLRPQIAIHHALVGARLLIAEKDIELRRSRRQPGEGEGDPPDQDAALGLRRGGQFLLFQFRRDEMIDAVRALRQGFGNRRLEGPVLLIGCPLLNPLSQRRLLRLGELLLALLRRHQVVGIIGGDAVPELALGDIAGNDCDLAALSLAEGRRRFVEA